jgi:CheY-like chemotaxis protein
MAKQKNIRIVVMEDSKALLKQLEGMFLKNGFQIEIATNGEEGIHKVESTHPAVVFTDLMMPLKDGFEVIADIKKRFPAIPVIAFSAQPASVVQKRVIDMGAEMFLQKPLKEQVLLGIARKYTDDPDSTDAAIEPKYLPTEDDQPYLTQIKACFICGCEHVNVFIPRPNSFVEDWTAGLFPRFTPVGNYQKWDFLKTTVSVCPSCFFASMDPNDFAMTADQEFPYKIEAKKIIAKSIGGRKRLIEGHKQQMDIKFTNPNRSPEVTMASFLLAEKCGNGLVMGEKKGAYAQMGYYALIKGVLDWGLHRDKADYQKNLRDALNLFENQLKLKTDRTTTVKCYYFIITLYSVLRESMKANEAMQGLERYYEHYSPEDAGDEEREWNQRLLHVWRVGVDMEEVRGLQY